MGVVVYLTNDYQLSRTMANITACIYESISMILLDANNNMCDLAVCNG